MYFEFDRLRHRPGLNIQKDMLGAGEFADKLRIDDLHVDLLEVFAANESVDVVTNGEALATLIKAGFIRSSPIRGYELTTRGQLVLTRERAERLRSNSLFSQFFKKLRFKFVA